jgi:hypothetical protein
MTHDLDIKEVKDSVEAIKNYIKVLEDKDSDEDTVKCKLSVLKVIRKILWKIVSDLEEKTRQVDIQPVLDKYDQKIHKIRKVKDTFYVTATSKNKIFKRLEIYTLEELTKAIDNFAADKWWMDHNSHRGIQWFFHSDDRIETFLNLPKDKRIDDEITDPSIIKLKKLTEKKC